MKRHLAPFACHGVKNGENVESFSVFQIIISIKRYLLKRLNGSHCDHNDLLLLIVANEMSVPVREVVGERNLKPNFWLCNF
jgi:hypothetical protein